MKLLVVQESDWLDVGVHDSHHIFERLSAEGWEITVIDYEVRNSSVRSSNLFSKRTVFNDVRKATKNGKVKVIRPAFVRMPVLNYLSIPITHYLEIRRELIRNRPDAVIGLGIINTSILSALAKKFDVPFFYYMIDQLDELIPIKRLRWVGRIMIRFSVANAKKVIVTNHGLLEYASQMGALPSQSVIVGHGVDPSIYEGVDGKQIREELGFKDDDVVLFFMGWLYDFCGLDIVIEQLESSNKVKLLIIGKGELSGSLQESARKNENVVLLDWKPFNELPKFIKASDVCILPFINNEITSNIVPIKIFEYLAAGKPVIATDLPGVVQEFGDDGIIFYMHHPKEILTILGEVLKERIVVTNPNEVKMYIKEQSWENKLIKFRQIIE